MAPLRCLGVAEDPDLAGLGKKGANSVIPERVRREKKDNRPFTIMM